MLPMMVLTIFDVAESSSGSWMGYTRTPTCARSAMATSCAIVSRENRLRFKTAMTSKLRPADFASAIIALNSGLDFSVHADLPASTRMPMTCQPCRSQAARMAFS